MAEGVSSHTNGMRIRRERSVIHVAGSLWSERDRSPAAPAIVVKRWLKRARLTRRLLAQELQHMSLRSQGARVHPTCHLSSLTILGDRRLLGIGAGTAIGRVAIHLHARITIGPGVAINDGAQLLTGSHDIDDPDWALECAPIEIEECAWIANSAIILPGVKVARGSVIGAGAVVAKATEPFGVYVGNPARLIRHRSPELRYQPSRLCALHSAWLGPASSSRQA